MLIINAEYIRKFDPCEPGIENFEKHYPKFEGKLSELLALEKIPYGDKIWLACRVTPDTIIKQWSIKCAELVLENYEKSYPNDSRIRDCLEVAKRYLQGLATFDELSAARSAAWSAARNAAGNAAGNASWSAESASWSAESAAWSATESAARSAGSAVRSARSAVRSAESATWNAAWNARSAAEKEQEDLNMSLLIALLDNEGM